VRARPGRRAGRCTGVEDDDRHVVRAAGVQRLGHQDRAGLGRLGVPLHQPGDADVVDHGGQAVAADEEPLRPERGQEPQVELRGGIGPQRPRHDPPVREGAYVVRRTAGAAPAEHQLLGGGVVDRGTGEHARLEAVHPGVADVEDGPVRDARHRDRGDAGDGGPQTGRVGVLRRVAQQLVVGGEHRRRDRLRADHPGVQLREPRHHERAGHVTGVVAAQPVRDQHEPVADERRVLVARPPTHVGRGRRPEHGHAAAARPAGARSDVGQGCTAKNLQRRAQPLSAQASSRSTGQVLTTRSGSSPSASARSHP
jgi:hypothetical protein